MNWEEIECKGYPSDKLSLPIFQQLGLHLSLFAPSVDSISRKLTMPIFLWHRVCGTWNVDRKTTTLRMRALGIVSLTASRFSTEILAKLEMLLTNQDNEVVEKLT